MAKQNIFTTSKFKLIQREREREREREGGRERGRERETERGRYVYIDRKIYVVFLLWGSSCWRLSISFKIPPEREQK